MAHPDKSSSLWQALGLTSYAPLASSDEPGAAQLQPSIGQILRSKRVRFVGAAAVVALVLLLFIYTPLTEDLNFDYLTNPFASPGPSTSPDTPTTPVPPLPDGGVDWSRFAYTQYATSTAYLCNSVMLFETLHRLGSRADRLLMHPSSMKADPDSDSTESRLLLKAQKEYNVKLAPIEVQHRDGGDRRPFPSRLWDPR
jgi:hypothetical protein